MRNRSDDFEDGDAALLASAEAELARGLAVEPSPAFKAGVRRRVAGERTAAPPWRWMWPVAAALCAAVTAAVALRPRRPEPRPWPTMASAPAEVRPSARPSAPPARVARVVAPTPSRRVASPADEVPVLVPPGEGRRVQAYYAAMMQAAPASVPVVAGELIVAPLEIAPLDPGI